MPTTIANLKIKLGRVATGTMTPGSPNLTGLGFSAMPWEGSGPPLMPSDVGARVSVIGAGPYMPITPAFGPLGEMLVTTLSAYVSGTSGTLAVAASNATQPGAANVVVYRDCDYKYDSVRLEKSLTSVARSTLIFDVESRDGSMICIEGMPVLLEDSVLGDLWGGSVDSVDILNTTGTPGDMITFRVSCVSWASLLERRLINPYILHGGVYVAQTLQYVGRDLVYNFCDSEGLSVNSVVGSTIDLNVSGTGSKTVAGALDDATKKASDSSNTYVWFVNPWRVVYVVKAQTNPSPWHVSDADGTDEDILVSVTYKRTRSKLVNSVYLVCTAVLTDTPMETLYGDGSAVDFSVSKPIGAVPAITVGGISKTVGVANSVVSFDWYWVQGSNSLTAAVAPGSGVAVTVTYKAQSTQLFTASNTASINTQLAIESGTGLWYQRVEYSQPIPEADGPAMAQTFADRLSVIPKELTVSSLKPGLDIGQALPVTLSQFSLTTLNYLIDSLVMTTEEGYLRWEIHCVNGPAIGDFLSAYATLLGAPTELGTGVTTIPDVAASIITPPLLPTAVTWSDHPSERVADNLTRVPSSPTYGTITLPSGHGAEWVHVWFCNAGVTEDYGTFVVGSTIKIWRNPGPVDITGNTVKVTTGKTGAENPLSTAVESAPFTITAIPTPAATTGITVTLGAFTAVQRRDGTWYGEIPPLQGTDPTSGTDFVINWTVQDIDSGGTPVGPEKIHDSWQITGPGDSHTLGQSLLITLTGQAGERYRGYLANRISQSTGDYLDPTTNTVQNISWNGGSPADQYDVMFGTLPDDAIPSSALTDFGGGFTQDVDGKWTLQFPGSLVLVNPGFETGDTSDWSVPLAGSPTADASQQHSGTYSANLGNTANTYLGQSFPCSTGQVFAASAWFKSSGATVGRASILILFFNSGGYFDQDSVYTSGQPTSWTQTSKTFIPAPAGTVSVQIIYGIDGGAADGTWWMDDCEMTPPLGVGGVGLDIDGNVIVKVAGPNYIDVSGSVNLRAATDFNVIMVGGLPTLNLQTVQLANAAGFDTTNFQIVGSTFLVKNIAVDALIAGNALFTGTATFAYSGAGKVTIGASGLILEHGTTGGKVTIGSSGVTIADNGSSPSATVTLSSSGITIARGSNSLAATATGITLSEGSGSSVTLTSGGISLIKGGFSVTVTAAQITIAESLGASVALSSTALTLSKGSNFVTLSATSLVLNNGSSSVTITSSSVVIVNGSLTSPSISGGSLSITASGTTTVINSSTAGITVVNGSDNTRITHSVIQVNSSSASSFLGISSLVIGQGSGSDAALAGNGLLIRALPSSSPGSKQFWYDPSDGNRVKYTP